MEMVVKIKSCRRGTIMDLAHWTRGQWPVKGLTFYKMFRASILYRHKSSR